MSAFTVAFDNVIIPLFGHEGGFQNNPKDPGNYRPDGTLVGTKYGISARSYPHLDTPNITKEEATDIYYKDFWCKMGCDCMPEFISEFVFDYGVNSGVGKVARDVQRAVGVLPDGIVGPATQAALSRAPQRNLLRLLFVARARTFAEAPRETYLEFREGWFARLFDKTEKALQSL